jgi:hypothetical protein
VAEDYNKCAKTLKDTDDQDQQKSERWDSEYISF